MAAHLDSVADELIKVGQYILHALLYFLIKTVVSYTVW